MSGGSADVVNPSGKSAPKRLLSAAWSEYDAAISPDGQWIAYTSSESGTPEIRVRPFSVGAAGGNWKVSAGG